MARIFLSYARADGKTAATRLRSELERAGFEVWRDIEDMQGGQAWKDQLRKSLRQVDGVIVLLTPAAVSSKYVEWEWENALTLEKRIIPLMILPCNVPDELKRLHYHNLSTEQDYVLGFAALMRDLYTITVAGESASLVNAAQDASKTDGRNVSIGGNAENTNVVTGDGNTVGSNNTTVQQSGKYDIKINKGQNLRIGDDFNG